MKIVRFVVSIGFALLVHVSPSFGVTLEITGGMLMGARGVNVDGSLLDVSFQDGTCVDLYDVCDQLSDFFFPDVASAQSANLALLNQVFRGTIFDSKPWLTNGCGAPHGNSFTCLIVSPIGGFFPSSEAYRNAFLFNTEVDSTDSSNGLGVGVRSATLFPRDDLTFALWSGSIVTTTPPETVPEPSTMLLLATGFIGIAGLAYSRNKS